MTGMTAWRLVLAVSLALNILLAAYIGGTAWQAAQIRAELPADMLRSPGGVLIDKALEDALPRLSAEDAGVVRQAIAAHAAALSQAQDAYLGNLEQVRAALAADRVDRASLQRAIERAEQSRLLLEPAIEAIILDAAPRLSADGRQRLAGARQR